MPRQIPRVDIIEAILGGIREAHFDYQKWSYGDWLDCAPEYLVTTYIAGAIMALPGPKYITLESNVKEAMKCAGHRCKGKLSKALRAPGRIDITLWWGYHQPRAAIEVKRRVGSYSGIESDARRIAEMIGKDREHSSYQFGVIAFYIAEDDSENILARRKIENRLPTILQRVRRSIGDRATVELESLTTRTDGVSSWTAACLVFYPEP